MDSGLGLAVLQVDQTTFRFYKRLSIYNLSGSGDESDLSELRRSI